MPYDVIKKKERQKEKGKRKDIKKENEAKAFSPSLFHFLK